jgi:oligopeptide/dipeptide ABC transporter ATP-binding protein
MLLEVKNLKKYFPIEKGLILKKVLGYVHAVDDISFSLDKGKTLGLVGESGSGKTTTAKMVVGLYPPTEGTILFESKDILRKENLQFARRNVGMVFQDPFSSLDPRQTVGRIITEPMRIQHLPRVEINKRLGELIESVRLKPEYAKRHAHELSGGERQRVAVARAISLNPSLVVADEAVSALDVSIQAQILNLIQDLQKEFGLAYLFISHDLSVVKHISDKVAVMYLGEIVESARTRDLFSKPEHPYTQALLSSVPIPGIKREKTAEFIKGEIPSSVNPPEGCRFHPRCPFADENCSKKPEYKHLGNDHYVACHTKS